MNMQNLETTLEERGKSYGDFTIMAELAQHLKWHLVTKSMNAGQREAMEVICTKLARLAVGDPNHSDSWLDIAGYATLAMKCIKSEPEKKNVDIAATANRAVRETPLPSIAPGSWEKVTVGELPKGYDPRPRSPQG